VDAAPKHPPLPRISVRSIELRNYGITVTRYYFPNSPTSARLRRPHLVGRSVRPSFASRRLRNAMRKYGREIRLGRNGKVSP
jgi:hypothetical protein